MGLRSRLTTLACVEFLPSLDDDSGMSSAKPDVEGERLMQCGTTYWEGDPAAGFMRRVCDAFEIIYIVLHFWSYHVPVHMVLSPGRYNIQDFESRVKNMTEVEEHNAALEKVTDFVEEKELNEDETKQLSTALSSLADPARAVLSAEESSAESSIKISAADVEIVTMELEVSKEEAHTALLKENGDVVRALRRLLQ